ncbi:MAG: Gfo/Idh/MocA family oxidoreductase [Verrucomicrobiota bacterium]|jgi:predicted dehydrogenase
MNKPLFRWGILGTAQIARKNWKAIRNSQNGVITAVASRTLERSRRFVAECQAEAPFATPPRAAGSYEDLLAAEDVDGVYIPLPTGIRKAWVLCAAQAGKHLVCEKPCAVAVGDLVEMLEACRRHRVQFMDGVMFMHSRRLELMRTVLNDGQTVGQIRRIDCRFSFNGPEESFDSNIRAHSQLEPHGCLGDLGWYCIRFALWALDWKLPLRASGRVLCESRAHPGQAPVPTEFSGELFFEGGVSGSFYCSFITQLEQWANISGTQGCLQLPDFVLPFFGCEAAFQTCQPAQHVQGCDFNLEPNARRWAVGEYSNSHPSAQESNLFGHFAQQVQSGSLNRAWPEMALKTQQVMQACRESSLAGGQVVELGRAASSPVPREGTAA